jgi:hypothetical protein
MTLLLAIPTAWILLTTLVVATCAAARRGDRAEQTELPPLMRVELSQVRASPAERAERLESIAA